MHIVLSSRLRELLSKIKDDISMTILNMENNNDFVFPFSMLDFSDEEGNISFLSTNKYCELPKDKGNGDLPWTCSARNNMKAGRIINKIAPFFKQAEVEKWVNSFKAEYKNVIKGIHFEIISGNYIAKYYNGKRYAYGNGSLNKSCMRHDSCEEFMRLYVQNPDKIKMLILLEDKEHIAGRALLWKLDEPKDTWFLDRIYVREDSDVIIFKNYAKENGWLYKNNQTFNAINVVKNGIESFVDMKVYINGHDYKSFPYLDTLQFLDKKNNYLTNSIEDYKTNPNIIKLREINGKNSGNEFFVEDIFNNEIIPIDDSVYCYYGDGYTHKNNAIFLDEYDEFAFPSEISYSDYQKKIIAVADSVYSHCLKSFVQSSQVRIVYLDKNRTKWDYMLLSDYGIKYSDIKGTYFINDILNKNKNGSMYFKDEKSNSNLENKPKASYFKFKK